ncbi:MAG TPA: hypothetical protein DCG08_03500 [Dialister sp.]|nr:hypothetical protein [Dialister sp.]
MTPREAVRSAYKKHPVMEVMRDELVDVLAAEAQRGGAADVEKKKLKAAMAKAWAEDGLTLSERTTHGRRWVVEQVTKTIEAAIKKGGSVMTLAKEFFDGYGHDHVIPKQEIPEFMGKLVALSKDYQGDTFKRALRDAQRNIDKLSTQGLKAAYKGIIGAISKGNEEMVDKAIYVATQERARYFAERIARTEKARAYADGVMYQYVSDPDCVAFKWKLSSRHPCDDICDLYANADLWGMGKGIFPKDKLPKLPVHPNCMCRVVPIFHGSMRVTSETPKDKTLAGGLAYIMSLTEMQRRSLLGVNGAKEVQKGASWKQYARGYSDEVMQCRILQYDGPKGSVLFDTGYDKKHNLDEVNMAEWLVENFAGKIKCLTAANEDHVKTPDYEWDGLYWDLKTVQTEKAADSAIRHAAGQIKERPGGVALNYIGENVDVELLERISVNRGRRSLCEGSRIIAVMNRKLLFQITVSKKG